MSVRVKVTFRGNLKNVVSDLKKKARVTANVGIINDPEIATYATYNEFGWTQQVTGRQSRFLGAAFGVHVKPGNALMSPPRPFMRATARDNANKWAKIIADAVKANGVQHVHAAVELVARQAQVDIQETIKNNGTMAEKFPLRSPMTLEIYASKFKETAKGNKRAIEQDSGAGRSEALLLSGRLLGAIGYEIK